MSYDLFFYGRKGSDSQTKIIKYLNEKLVEPNNGSTQWFFENEDTEVYYSFEMNDPDPENEQYEKFEDTNFSFNLNFIRPSFFGIEAFKFVEQFCEDLDLCVDNPQSGTEAPYKPGMNEQCEIWNKTNSWAIKDHFDPNTSCFVEEEKCNKIWEYNFARKSLQKDLGEEYFVPKIFFFKTLEKNEVITLSTWTENIPIVLPISDYFLMTRNRKKLFKTVKENFIISRKHLLEGFGPYFVDFEFPGCKIIHPNIAEKLGEKFSAMKPGPELVKFAERIHVESLYNVKP